MTQKGPEIGSIIHLRPSHSFRFLSHIPPLLFRPHIRLFIRRFPLDTPNTLDRWYFRYLAMGRVGVAPAPRHRVTNAVPPEDKENFKKAINQFYYSSKKRSLKTTYEMMLLHFYRDENQMIPSMPWRTTRVGDSVLGLRDAFTARFI